MFFLRLTKVFLLVFFLSTAVDSYAQKLKAEDIVAKHLDSIGTSEARASVKSQIAAGETLVKFVSQRNATLQGRVVFASEGDKSFLGMRFDSTDYPSERFSYDGKKGKVGFVRLGTRSMLGNFILSNSEILEEGLLGGTLSSSWSLLDLTRKNAKLSAGGTKKIDGKETYVLNFSPKGGGDVDIKLYFDKETFRHVRTEYKRVASAGIGKTPEQSSQLIESRISLTEDFSDFKEENKLTLPHSYRLFYSISGQNGTNEIEWTFKLNEFAFNQNLSPDTFDAESNK